MDFVQKYIVHGPADASPILPMHVALVRQDGGAFGLEEPLAADATLADVIVALNSLVVGGRAEEPVEQPCAEPMATEAPTEPEPAPEQGPGAPKPTMKWAKDDIAAYAAAHGVEVDADDTKADLLDKLEAL